jgi:hypothetical protein
MLNAVVSQRPFSITDGRHKVSPLLAQQIIDRAPYEGQRHIHEEHIEKWAFMMIEGTFLEHQGISFGLMGGRLYLVNGQHRLRAVISTGKTIGFDITIYECESAEELDQLYSRFDTEALQRSTKDVISHDQLINKDFPAQYLARLCDAVQYIEVRFQNVARRKMPTIIRIKERRVVEAHKWVREARIYREYSKGVPVIKTRPFFATLTLAIAVVTIKYAPDEAETFWKAAIRNDGLRVGEPARALLETWERKTKWTAYQRGHIAALAFNASYRNEEMHRIVLPRNEPIFLEGTPY